MSINPRVAVKTTTFIRDPQNAYTTKVTDGTLTQNRSYNGFGEVTEVSNNTFTYELSQRDQSGAITQNNRVKSLLFTF